MKTISAIGVAMLTAGLFSGAASAQMRSSTPSNYGYVFGQYDHYSADGDSLDGGGIGAGYRINRYFAIQGGGQYARKYGADFSTGYGEVLAILPVGRRLSFYGSFGGTYADVSASASISNVDFTVSRHTTGSREGLGAEYWFAPHWGLNAAWHRQNTFGVVDDFGVGVSYRFW